MWVVHSLNPERDLQPLDLRRRLIQHAQDPMARVRELEKQAARTDSEFERQVLTRLLDAGYKVITQWRVGYYRIDLVVEGRSSRLAVECDGDRYHTMDNLREDMARQAVLERLGWKFVRIRGTRFFRDPDSEVARIISRLDALGIEKSAATSPDGAQPSNQELTERLNRAAEEIRQLWAADPAYVYEEQPAKQRRPSSLKKGWPKASESRQKQPEPESPPPVQEDELPLEVDADDSNGRSIDDIPQERIREALRQLVPKGSRVGREDLLKKLAAALGQQRLGRKIRSRLNRAIGGEARAHNLETDWDFVWRPSDSEFS
jgi:very-short-patch-repair endonuclease